MWSAIFYVSEVGFWFCSSLEVFLLCWCGVAILCDLLYLSAVFCGKILKFGALIW